jgi:ABC-2 type transport system ATP-binding protein
VSVVENTVQLDLKGTEYNPFIHNLPERANLPSVVIDVANLEVSYKDFKAVRGINLQVRAGEIFGILGPNGAGKTTTLSVIEGLRKPTAGRVEVLGYDVARQPAQVRQRIGVALQTNAFFDDLNLYELIEMYAAMYNVFPSRAEITTMLTRFGLADKAKSAPGKLSGGQAQRVALLLSIINQPEIIFLDEPTTGLDPQTRRNIWEVIKELRAEGRTVVLTTHYMEEAQELCHRLAIIDQGQIIALGTPGQLINRLGAEARITVTARLPLDEVRRIPGVSRAEYEGERLTVYFRENQQSLFQLQQLAVQHQQVLGDLSVKQPDLEDVFLALTGRSLRS